MIRRKISHGCLITLMHTFAQNQRINWTSKAHHPVYKWILVWRVNWLMLLIMIGTLYTTNLKRSVPPMKHTITKLNLAMKESLKMKKSSRARIRRFLGAGSLKRTLNFPGKRKYLRYLKTLYSSPIWKQDSKEHNFKDYSITCAASFHLIYIEDLAREPSNTTSWCAFKYIHRANCISFQFVAEWRATVTLIFIDFLLWAIYNSKLASKRWFRP